MRSAVGVETIFRVLGPLEIDRGGQPVSLRPAKQRTLLAVLLLRANVVVPVSLLVDCLWEEAPPAGAKGAVQAYVMRLRQAIGDHDARLIKTRPDGYALETGVENIDLQRFHVLVTRAQASHEPAERAAALREAVGLWRGPLLSDVGGAALRERIPDIPIHAEARLQALEQYFDAELQLGRHDELLDELRAMTAEHPLRERFWGQLMVALYRAHRQEEALAAHAEVTRLLAEELGIDTGAEIRALHERIRDGDLSLTPQPPRTPAVVPAQLPADPGELPGRADLVDEITELLVNSDDRPTVPLVVLTGSPDGGRAELAARIANRARPAFPGGQLHAALTAGSDTGRVLIGFLHALGVREEQVPPEAEERTALYRSLLAKRRVLVVLDSVTGPDQVRPLLPGDSGCAVLVTSENDLRGLTALQGARQFRVDRPS
ncbi:AfsR/SARP family transcriptional regulator [Allokutzneria albata]|uniref:DNA-binding transcriptional activator of the SARP family n=1 Tax=Allokutzneria albata TaxID=211114 RepID=A0A1H0CQB2_ALLAB|nr:AfsR/SARP family transcriptional regulator [Allokutzneria albata]SDN60079.1 DNA-binding transcriptional activator of the SARP family [Allokutzneria albata]